MKFNPPLAVVLLREAAEEDRIAGHGNVDMSLMSPFRKDPFPRLQTKAQSMGWEVFGLGDHSPTVCPRIEVTNRHYSRWSV